MTHAAWSEDGRALNASDFAPDEWRRMKSGWKTGVYRMTCCNAAAQLKTSANGVQFFSHLANECAIAPETVWHREGKAVILDALQEMGIEGREKASGISPSARRWQADILFESSGRLIAIELQRSYQTLHEFLLRQERFASAGMECYWLMRQEGFRTLQKATLKEALLRDFGHNAPSKDIGTGMIPELPVAMLVPGVALPVQFGQLKSSTVRQWLEALVTKQFKYRFGTWNLV